MTYKAWFDLHVTSETDKELNINNDDIIQDDVYFSFSLIFGIELEIEEICFFLLK